MYVLKKALRNDIQWPALGTGGALFPQAQLLAASQHLRQAAGKGGMGSASWS